MTEKTVINNHNKQTLFRWSLIAFLSVFASGLAYAILSIPSETPSLQELAVNNLDVSGVSHAVTAVLLNYRAYDTLLEMGVVLLALVAVWSLGDVSKQQIASRNVVLDLLTQLLVPLLILVAGYLLWVGAHAPGGAFQAGSLLAAAGVLLLLSGWHVGSRFMGFSLRIAMVAGLFMFVLVGTVVMISGQAFLEYPLPYAGPLILMIEAAATLAIGLTLAALFLGGRPKSQAHGEQN